MPITNNASYVPTMNEFAAHWQTANTQLGSSGPLIVAFQQGPETQAGLVARRQALEQQQEDIQGRLNDLETEQGLLLQAKTALLASLREFVGLLNSYWADSEYIDARPPVPGLTDGQEKFLAPIKDMKTLWSKLEQGAAPPGLSFPLTLSTGLTLGGLGTALAAIQARYGQVQEADFLLTFDRRKRQRMQKEDYKLLKLYRATVEARCQAYPDLLASLPRLTPLPGHTPEPVAASAVFQPPNQAKIVFEASEDPELSHYALEGNAGGQFHSDDAVQIATLQPDDPREFVTSFGLTQPGARASFVVTVILTTGNRRASAPMTVVRPA